MEKRIVSTQDWKSPQSEMLRQIGPDALLLYYYLTTSPHSNPIGLYYLPIGYIESDTSINQQRITAIFKELEAKNICKYKENWVWVLDMARSQFDCLSPKDNRVKGIQKLVDSLHANPFTNEFIHRHANYLKIRELNPQERKVVNIK